MIQRKFQQEQPLREKKIVYVQDNERKTMSESQAIHMIKGIAEKNLLRALETYFTLTQKNPHAELLLEQFYQTLLEMFMFEELLEITTSRLRIIPSCKTSFSWKAKALQSLGRSNEARELLETAVQSNEFDWNTLGKSYNDVAKYTAASTCFETAIEINPSFAEAHYNRSIHRRDPRSELANIQKLISGNRVSEEDSHQLHFAAYHYCETLGQYENAFEHLQIANALKRRSIDYHIQTDLDLDENSKAVFSPELMHNLVMPSQSALKPIFILGLPGSGAALVEQLLHHHSGVAMGGKSMALASTVKRAQGQLDFDGSPEQLFSSLSSQDWQRIGLLYEHNTRLIRGEKSVFTDRNPFNHRSIGIIKASLANAKVIVVERNPMDVSFACYRQLFGQKIANFTYQFGELAKNYASYMALIDYWSSLNEGFILRIHYEELVQDQYAAVNKLIKFCDLELQRDQATITHNSLNWKPYEKPMQAMLKQLEKSGLA